MLLKAFITLQMLCFLTTSQVKNNSLRKSAAWTSAAGKCALSWGYLKTGLSPTTRIQTGTLDLLGTALVFQMV